VLVILLRRWPQTALALSLCTVLVQGLLPTAARALSLGSGSLDSVEVSWLTATAGSPTAPEAPTSPSEPGPRSQSPRTTRTGKDARLDPGLVRALALISILVAAGAGLYVYRVIRRGL
jgi:hypothetical protein